MTHVPCCSFRQLFFEAEANTRPSEMDFSACRLALRSMLPWRPRIAAATGIANRSHLFFLSLQGRPAVGEAIETARPSSSVGDALCSEVDEIHRCCTSRSWKICLARVLCREQPGQTSLVAV